MSEKLFIKGFTYGWSASRGNYRQSWALDSMRKLKETGSEWIALSFYTYQDTFSSTKIPFDYGYTVTDRDIERAIKNAHEMGLKVCLKPVVNSKDGVWRAEIDFPDQPNDGTGKTYWDQWFESYTNFICHYAELAEELGCEMFCIGCEMVASQRKVKHWENLIARVREIYTGPIIYNANHGSEDEVAWFDKVDIIGTSAYYRVGTKPGDSEENMIQNWLKVKERIRKLHEKFQKPIVFMEIGCRSAHGCSMMPWDFMHRDLPFDEDEQANFYSSVMKVFWDEPWFSGFFWWDWSTRLYDIKDAKANKGFDIYGKKAEDILRKWYKEK